MALSVSVSRDGTDRVVFEFVRHADSIILLMRQCTSRRSSMEQQNSPPEFRMVAADVNHMHTDHPTSTHACRWPWNPSRVHNGSLSYTRPCRATTSGPRSSAGTKARRLSGSGESWAQVGRQGIGTMSKVGGVMFGATGPLRKPIYAAPPCQK